MIRVVVADDQELVRDGLSLVLDAQDDIEVVGTAADGAEAWSVVRATDPDVVLMDVRMPRVDGIEATRGIVGRSRTRVLVLTTYDADDQVLQALRAGASGFLLKDTPRSALIAAVRAVAAGEVLLDQDVVAQLVATVRVDASASVTSRLTDRETEVLRAVARGLSNAEIAQELFIGEATVKTHVGNLLDKLSARDRIQLVVLAHSSGLA